MRKLAREFSLLAFRDVRTLMRTALLSRWFSQESSNFLEKAHPDLAGRHQGGQVGDSGEAERSLRKGRRTAFRMVPSTVGVWRRWLVRSSWKVFCFLKGHLSGAQPSESHPPKTHQAAHPRTPAENVVWFRSLYIALQVYTLTSIFSGGYIKNMESVFEIIAEPNRRAILSLLVSSQQSVGEIERQLRMPQPAVSKHLRVLREAGFVESTVDAQRRLYRLKPGPLQEVDAWLAQFRRFWSAHLDALERHLDGIDQSTPTKSKTRKTTRPNRELNKGETK
jgi:DNA-binding transcriptional ArsR family regulator